MWSTEIGSRPTVRPMLNVCHIFWGLILGQISWVSVFNSVPSDFSCRLSACGQIAVTIWEMSPLLSLLPSLTAPRSPASRNYTSWSPASLFPTDISPKSYLSEICNSIPFLKSTWLEMHTELDTRSYTIELLNNRTRIYRIDRICRKGQIVRIVRTGRTGRDQSK